MRKTTILTAILSAALAAAMTTPATAAGYDVMPNGYTFEVEDTGTYTFDFSGGKNSKPAQNESAPSEKSRQTTTAADISGYADEVIRLTNAEREKAGLPPLEADDTLMEMAQQRVNELVESYSHTRPDGSRCFTVFDDFDSTLKPMNENIANGQKSPEKAVSAWMKSTEGHREAILRDNSQYIGTAVAKDAHGRLYWVQLMAK